LTANDFNPYDLLRRERNIELVFRKLPASLKGYFGRYKDSSFIVLSKSLTQVERRCVLAEELAHYYLGHSGNYLAKAYYGGLGFDKQEHDAKVWAADRLIDTHNLLEIAQRDHQLTVEDICDHFWVTKEVLFFKLNRLANIRALSHFFMPDVT